MSIKFDPIRIIGEETEWAKLANNDREEWKEKLAKNKGEIINQISLFKLIFFIALKFVSLTIKIKNINNLIKNPFKNKRKYAIDVEISVKKYLA